MLSYIFKKCSLKHQFHATNETDQKIKPDKNTSSEIIVIPIHI